MAALTEVMGLEFSKRPSPQIAVHSSSSVTSAFPRMLLRAFLAALIIASNTPPKGGPARAVRLLPTVSPSR